MPPHVMIKKTAVIPMARPKVYSINLTDEERSRLNKVIKSKTTCETVLKRCQILRILMNQKAAN